MSRRSVLSGGAVVGVSAVLGYVVASNTSAADPASATAAANDYGVGGGSDEVTLARVDDIPTDGPLVLGDQGVVLTWSASGSVQAFSAVCTHQGCTVQSADDGSLLCPCHASRFDSATGDVLDGPAGSPLPAVAVEVRGDDVVATSGG